MDTGRSALLREQLLTMLPSLRGYARALARDSHAADDLVQQAVMHALTAEAQWEEGDNARPWVFTILRNAWLGGLREARRTVDHAAQTHAAEAQTGQAQTGQAQTGQAALRELSRAMDDLPAPQREALVLVGAQGLSIAEAAAICGVAPGTIKARISRGRQALRARLDRR